MKRYSSNLSINGTNYIQPKNAVDGNSFTKPGHCKAKLNDAFILLYPTTQPPALNQTSSGIAQPSPSRRWE